MSIDVLSARSAALEQVASLQLPTKRDEAWRYAPHTTPGSPDFGPASDSAALPADIDADIPAIDGARVVLVNGVFDAERSRLGSLPDSLRVQSLADATAEDLAGVPQRDYDAGEDAFSILNRAHGTGGALIMVNGQVEDAVHIVDIVAPDAPHAVSATRVVVEMAAGSAATLVETRIGGGESGGCNLRTEISLATEARLEHIVLQDLPANHVHLGRVDVVQAEGSSYQARLFNLGADYGRVAYHVYLDGEGAEADLSGLYFGFGKQTLDQQITVVHAVPNCRSSQSYRGVLDDESTGIWNGGVDVRPGADGTDSEQSNDNLVLSRKAEVNTMPRLEILADEVSCQHGATVGELDDEALYYLRSRGIAESEARRLLIDGFADQVMDDLSDDVLRAWIIERLGHAHA